MICSRLDVIAGCNKFDPTKSSRPHERLLSLTEDSPSSPDCRDDPLAAFGRCPGVKPTNKFAVMTGIPRSEGSAAPAAQTVA